MSKPTADSLYVLTVSDLTGSKEDVLNRIASIAYGDASRSANIDKSNQVQAIGVGTVLKLPPSLLSDEQPVVRVVTPGLVLLLGTIEVPAESLRFFESDESMVDAWSAMIEWLPGVDPDLDKLIRPYSYTRSALYLNGDLLATGRLYGVSPGLSNRSEVALEFFSFACDVLDSSLAPPYEENNVTLKQRAQTIVEPFMLSVTVDLEEDGVFDRVTAQDSDTAGAHLMDLARQRGALVSSTPKGGIYISVPAATGVPVAAIEEGAIGFSGFKSTFDGRDRFSDYRVIGETPSDDALNAVVQDEEMPITRFKTIKVKDTAEGGLDRAAQWEKIRFLSKSLSIPIIAEGFFASSGVRWKKGDFVTLKSPTLFINEARLMRIRSVEFLSDSSGAVSTLSLVPSEIYTTGEFE